YTIDLAAIGEGALHIMVTAVDIYGNTASAEYDYTIAFYPEAPTDLTAVSTLEGVQLTWTPSVSENVVSYHIYTVDNRGSSTLAATVDSTVTAWTHTNVTHGEEYTYVVAAEKQNGLIAVSSSVNLIYLRPDHEAPVLNVSPGDGAMLTDRMVTFDIYAYDESEISALTMSYIKDGETIVVSEAPYAIDLAAKGEGELDITFSASDIYGNTVSETYSYTVAFYPDAPADLTAVSTTEGVQLSWTASESDGIVGYHICLVDSRGSMNHKATVDGNVTTWTHTDAVHREEYTYVVVAEKQNGLTAQTPSVEIVYLRPDHDAPVLTISGPENGSRVWNKAEFDFMATDADIDIAKTVVYTIGDGAETEVQVENGRYIIDLSGLGTDEEGKTLTVTFTAKDSSGNEASAVCSYTIDNIPNAVTNLQAEGKEIGIVLTWTPADLDDNVQEYCLLRSGSDGSTARMELSRTSAVYIDRTVTRGVTYVYQVVALGCSGHSAASNAAECILPLDETAPTITGFWPTDGVRLLHHTTLKVAAADAGLLAKAEITITSDRLTQPILLTKALSAPAGETVFELPWDLSELSGGNYQISYKVYDQAGNSTSAEAAVWVEAYALPEQPVLSAAAKYKSATLTWTYDGSFNTMDHFTLYRCDANGQNLRYVTALRGFGHTMAIGAGETCSFVVEACDIYGGTTLSEVVTV
ncbi:MAG: fibronectin type III domain-containing protein, partial [Clostridia bacterium]|nr:fibronectin type III domain-containing protein [Clostridia bacterium]